MPLSRRALLAATAPVVAAVGPLGRLLLDAARAEDRARPPEPVADRRRRRLSIERGCAFLANMQRRDGGFGDDKAVIALTALSVLALMAGGSTDGRGTHGEAVRRGTDFLLDLIETTRSGTYAPEGYFTYTGDTDSKMHGQGYAALALASVLGTADQRRAARVRTAVVKAVRCMEASQTSTGGYGYEPSRDSQHEGSVTVCVAQALRAARDAGVLVSADVVRAGLRYLKNSQIKERLPDGRPGMSDGGFRYSDSHEKHSYALTAAAISSFFLFGSYSDDADRTIQRGLEYMMRDLERRTVAEEWYYYGHFYASWAFWQKDGGDWSNSSWWGRWSRRVLPDLIDRRQQGDGSWNDQGGQFAYGPVLATAFAVLALAVPDETLPVFQR
jgi:hypothetical protein